MDVLLVRHGAAVSALSRLLDEHRWLTPEGRETTRRVGKRLGELGVVPTAIYTSPLVRAVQTADLLAAELGCARVETHPPLAADHGSTGQVLEVLARHGEGDVLLLVTHEPKIRGIAATLAHERTFPAFPTSGVAHFRGPREQTRFLLAIEPRTLTIAHSIEDIALV